jgi:hypothetical protein
LKIEVYDYFFECFMETSIILSGILENLLTLGDPPRGVEFRRNEMGEEPEGVLRVVLRGGGSNRSRGYGGISPHHYPLPALPVIGESLSS